MYTEKEEKYYCSLNQKKLIKLSDKELVKAVHIRKEIEAVKQMKANVSYDEIRRQRSDPEMTVDAVYYFYSSVIEHPKLDIDELGMYYFLAGYTREYYVPYLSGSLTKIKADEYKAVFDDFIRDNNIDVNDLSQFPKEVDSDFYKRAKDYDFSATDEKLRGMTGIIELLAQYIRENIACFAEEAAPAKPKKPGIIETQNKKTLIRNLLKQVLTALHEKRFDDVVALVTESTLNAEDIEECVQGTVVDNDFHTIDKYIAKNVEELYVDGNRTCIGYYLTADGNNDLPMYLTIDLIENDDGTVSSILDIEPD